MMDGSFVNRCLGCSTVPDSRSFGSSDNAGIGSQTANIECACGRSVSESTPEEADAMPAAVAAWNAANPE